MPDSESSNHVTVENPHEAVFQTDHLRGKLRHKSISGGIVTLSAQVVKMALTLLSTAVLARLLLPRDFGFVAMIMAVTGLLSSLKDAGLSMATIQAEKITHAQVSNLFWVNVIICIALALITAAFAPIISWFYRTPQLTPLTLALAATFILDGLAVQHLAIFSRQMRFSLAVGIEVFSMLVGQCVAIGLAFAGAGSWSLVASTLTISLCTLLASWSLCSWRPQLPKFKVGTRHLITFGANLTAASCLSYVGRSVDNFMIGRLYGAQAVGLYSRAAVLLRRPVDQLIAPLTSVVQPTLSRLQGDPERYRQTFLQIYSAIALVGLPLTGLVLALSHPFVLVLLGPKWDAAAGIFGAFTLVTLYSPLAYAAAWLFDSQGRGRELLMATSINVPIAILSIFVGLPYGPYGVAVAISVSGLFVRLPIQFYIATRSGAVRLKDLWIGLAGNLYSWAATFAFTSWLLHCLSGRAPALQLAVCIPAGLALAAVMAFCLPPQRRLVINLSRTLSSVLRERAAAAA